MRSRGAHAELEGSRTVPKTPAVLGAIPNGFANRQTLDRRFAVRAAPTKPSRKSLTLESLLRRREKTAARPAPTVRSAPIGHWLIGEQSAGCDPQLPFSPEHDTLSVSHIALDAWSGSIGEQNR